MHDDLQVMRQLVMEKCLQDRQIPCRWSEDMGYGYGFPIFNYYPPLPYYFGQVFHSLGLSLVDTVKALVILNFIISGLGMYLLAQLFWGRWGGVISGLLFIYAPYHAVDIYVRGAVNEAWALAWMPFILWFIYKIIQGRRGWHILGLALSSAFLMLSHNPTLMIFAPLAAVWSVFWLIQNRNFRSLSGLAIAGFWAVGLAAFFTLPVLFEQSEVHIETIVMGYFNYLAHFVSLNQLFISNFWGYGPSILGTGDGMGFQIGYIHWILAALSLLTAVLLRKKNSRLSLMIVLIFSLTLFYTFMAHERSSFIWKFLPPLEYLQFPWRFLTLSVLGFSFLGGHIIWLLGQLRFSKLQAVVMVGLILGIIFLYKDYFKWEKHWDWVNDQNKLSGELWKLQITAGIFDYLPKSAPRPPGGPPNGDIEIIKGRGNTDKILKNSFNQRYKVGVEEEAIVQINTYYFPGWTYFLNGQEIKADTLDKELGRPLFKLPKGEYTLEAIFRNTPIRTAGNIISLISWAILTYVFLRNFRPAIKKLIKL